MPIFKKMHICQEKQEIFLLKLIFQCHAAKEEEILFLKAGGHLGVHVYESASLALYQKTELAFSF